jgi:predicted nucleotidyltransferase
MLTRQLITQRIQAQADRLKSLGVSRLELFGSFARDEGHEQSDVDFLVDFDEVTFDRYMELKFMLEELLGHDVDLVIRRSLKPALRESVLREALRVA